VTSEHNGDGPSSDPRAARTAGRTGVFVADTAAERDDAFEVRRSVFVDEQGVDAGLEYDEHDEPGADATHFVAYVDGSPIGAARLRSANGAEPSSGSDDGSAGKVERVAVAADSRGDGWGHRVMEAIETRAREEGFDRLTLHAQTHVRGFYDHLGYEARGEEFEEAGIPHIAMDKQFEGSA